MAIMSNLRKVRKQPKQPVISAVPVPEVDWDILNHAAETFKVRHRDYKTPVAFWGAVSPGGDLVLSPNTACHAGLNGFFDYCYKLGDKPKYLFNGIQSTSLTKVQVRNHLDWLINRGIFAQYHLVKDVEWCMENGLVVLEPDTSCNVLANAMIALRGVSENKAEGYITGKLTSLGVHPQLAFFISWFYSWSPVMRKAGLRPTTGRSSGHSCVVCNAFSEDDFISWISYRIPHKAPSWLTENKYYGVGATWDTSSHTLNRSFSFDSGRSRWARDYMANLIDPAKSSGIKSEGPFSRTLENRNVYGNAYDADTVIKHIINNVVPKFYKDYGDILDA